MLKEIGHIIDKLNGKIKVKFTRKPMCSSCKFDSFCGSTDQIITIDSKNFFLEKGDNIEVGIEEKKSLITTLVTFLIPILIFIFILFLLKEKGELLSFIIAILALVIYYLIIKKILVSKKEYFNLKILRKL